MDNFIKILEITSYPIVILIIFFFLKKHIISLFNHMRKISYGETTLEIHSEQSSSNTDNKAIIFSKGETAKNKDIEKAISFFSEQTIRENKSIIMNILGIDKANEDDPAYRILMNYSILLFIGYNFEKLYNDIYGSQLKIIQRINEIPLTEDEIKAFYDEAKMLYPDIYNKYEFPKYLEYIINMGLITKLNDKYSITFKGKDFLKFMLDLGKPFNKSL